MTRSQLFKQMNYLNIREYQGFCDRHNIPYHIHIEIAGRLKKTGDKDRKNIVLKRIQKFVQSGNVGKPTVFANNVVSDKTLKLVASARIHYGQYDKKNPAFIKFMKSLTGGQFKNGAVARIVLRDFWTTGKAPTLKEFAKAWLNSRDGYLENHPEAAYLTDRKNKGSDKNWKTLRNQKAKQVLAVLNKL